MGLAGTIQLVELVLVGVDDVHVGFDHDHRGDLSQGLRVEQVVVVEEDDELDIKLENTREYNAQIKGNPSERELDIATLIAVGAPTLEICEDAVKQVRHELDQPEIAVSRWRGAQSKLWLAFNPGSEKHAHLDEYRNPTSAHLWGRFTPLISTRVGDSRGTPLAENQNTFAPSAESLQSGRDRSGLDVQLAIGKAAMLFPARGIVAIVESNLVSIALGPLPHNV